MVIWFIALMVSCFRLTEEMLALMPIFPEPELSPGEKRLTKLYFPACFLLAGTCVFWNHLSLNMTEKAPFSKSFPLLAFQLKFWQIYPRRTSFA